MKIDMIVGGRFNAPPMAAALARLSDLKVYSSIPASYWPGAERCIRFIPHMSILYEKVSRRLPGRHFKDKSTHFFSKLSSIVMRDDTDVLYAWATFGREAMLKARKLECNTILDRACPHIYFQEELLMEESELLGVSFSKSAVSFVERCVEEYNLADIIVVPSNYTKRSFLEKGFSESSLRLISLGPNFKPKQEYKPKLRKKSDSFTVGVVAGSLLRKGLLYLIDAWNGLNLPNAKLKLKCSVAELNKSPSLWHKINSNPTIEIVGYMKDLENIYRSCELFCLPSVDDGFGMVVFEAIACGCPVLVTHNVGAADIVIDGETGYIVNARSSSSLSEKLQELYNDCEKLASMSRSCAQFYKSYLNSPAAFDNQVRSLVTHIEIQRSK